MINCLINHPRSVLYSPLHLDAQIVRSWHQLSWLRLLLPAATKLGQGNIFRGVCQEFCPWGGGGDVWSRGVPPNFRGGEVLHIFGGLKFLEVGRFLQISGGGGSSKYFGGFPPNFQGGRFLQIFGGFLQIFGGVSNFSGAGRCVSKFPRYG